MIICDLLNFNHFLSRIKSKLQQDKHKPLIHPVPYDQNYKIIKINSFMIVISIKCDFWSDQVQADKTQNVCNTIQPTYNQKSLWSGWHSIEYVVLQQQKIK